MAKADIFSKVPELNYSEPAAKTDFEAFKTKSSNFTLFSLLKLFLNKSARLESNEKQIYAIKIFNIFLFGFALYYRCISMITIYDVNQSKIVSK